MTLRIAIISIALSTLAWAGSVAAQDAPSSVATLRVDTGAVKTSTGGDFTAAATGQRIRAGERLMLEEGGTATLTYGNDCQMTLTAPGVYTVPTTCHRQSAGLLRPVAITAGVLLGVGVVAAIGGGGDKDPPPASR